MSADERRPLRVRHPPLVRLLPIRLLFVRHGETDRLLFVRHRETAVAPGLFPPPAAPLMPAGHSGTRRDLRADAPGLPPARGRGCARGRDCARGCGCARGCARRSPSFSRRFLMPLARDRARSFSRSRAVGRALARGIVLAVSLARRVVLAVVLSRAVAALTALDSYGNGIRRWCGRSRGAGRGLTMLDCYGEGIRALRRLNWRPAPDAAAGQAAGPAADAAARAAAPETP